MLFAIFSSPSFNTTLNEFHFLVIFTMIFRNYRGDYFLLFNQTEFENCPGQIGAKLQSDQDFSSRAFTTALSVF